MFSNFLHTSNNTSNVNKVLYHYFFFQELFVVLINCDLQDNQCYCNKIICDSVLEVCKGPGLARGSYPARQMRDDFSNGPGRLMRGDFSNEPGQADKREMRFKMPGPGYKKARQKYCVSIQAQKFTAYYYYYFY